MGRNKKVKEEAVEVPVEAPVETVAKAPTKKKEEKVSVASPLSKGLNSLKGVLKGSDALVHLTKESLGQVHPHIPTGAFIIDYLIGGEIKVNPITKNLENKCPGTPRGKIFNLYGHESSGKTTLALATAAKICQYGGTCAYIDWEHAIVPTYAKLLGVPIEDESKFLLFQPNTLEDGVRILIGMATAGVDLIVIDSVGAAIPEVIFNQSLEKLGEGGGTALLPRKWSEYLPTIQKYISKSNTALIAIAQTRANISFSPGAKSTNVQGGNGWKFFSAVRIFLRAVKKLKRVEYNQVTRKKEEREFGRIIRAKVEKCKLSETQGYEQDFFIIGGIGIDNLRTLVEIGIAYNVIIKGGAWLTWERQNGEIIKEQGLEKFISAVNNLKNGYPELQRDVLPLLGQNSSSNTFEEEEEEIDFLSEFNPNTNPDLDFEEDE